MPQPMPVPILTKRKSRRGPGDAGVLLAQRQHVDVVVEHDRAAELAGHGVADRVAVPARHDRRRDRHARGGSRPGPGTPIPAPIGPVDAQPRPAPCAPARARRRAPASGPCRMSQSGGCAWPSTSSRPSVTPTDMAGGADRDADEADVRRRGRPASSAGRRARPPARPPAASPSSASRATSAATVVRETLEPVGQLGPRQRPLVAQLGEDPGLHRALGPARQRMTHGGILARRVTSPAESAQFARAGAPSRRSFAPRGTAESAQIARAGTPSARAG